MWIAKGIVLSIWLFSFGWLFSLVRLYLIARKLSGGKRPGMFLFGIEALLPISNPSFWLWLVACLALGLIAARNWPGKPILWVSLAVTELVPVGLLVMFLILMSRNRAMMK
jgi:hypothetical protein